MKGELRNEWDPNGEIPKNLPREDSEWRVYLGMGAYPSMKAQERQCIVWLCVTYPHAFYLIVENCWIIIIIDIKMFGLINYGGMVILCSLEP